MIGFPMSIMAVFCRLALQLMLMHADDQQVVLLPAWPKDWNVDFKLHAPMETVIEGSVCGGEVIRLGVSAPGAQPSVVIARK